MCAHQHVYVGVEAVTDKVHYIYFGADVVLVANPGIGAVEKNFDFLIGGLTKAVERQKQQAKWGQQDSHVS